MWFCLYKAIYISAVMSLRNDVAFEVVKGT